MRQPLTRADRGPRPDIADGTTRPTITRWMVDGSRVIRLDYIWGGDGWDWAVVTDHRQIGWCGSENLDKVLGQPDVHRSLDQAIEHAKRNVFSQLTRLNEEQHRLWQQLARLQLTATENRQAPLRAPW